MAAIDLGQDLYATNWQLVLILSLKPERDIWL